MCVCLFVCVHVFPSLSQDANNCFLFRIMIITYMVTVFAGITVFACIKMFWDTGLRSCLKSVLSLSLFLLPETSTGLSHSLYSVNINKQETIFRNNLVLNICSKGH